MLQFFLCCWKTILLLSPSSQNSTFPQPDQDPGLQPLFSSTVIPSIGIPYCLMVVKVQYERTYLVSACDVDKVQNKNKIKQEINKKKNTGGAWDTAGVSTTIFFKYYWHSFSNTALRFSVCVSMEDALRSLLPTAVNFVVCLKQAILESVFHYSTTENTTATNTVQIITLGSN